MLLTGTEGEAKELPRNLAPMLAPTPDNSCHSSHSSHSLTKVEATASDAIDGSDVLVSPLDVKDKPPLSIADNEGLKSGRLDSNQRLLRPERKSTSSLPAATNKFTELGKTACTKMEEFESLSPDLMKVVRCWDELPEAIRLGISAMVDSVSPSEPKES